MKGTIVAQVDSSESFQEFCSTGCLGAYENKQNPPKSGVKSNSKCTVCGKLTEVSAFRASLQTNPGSSATIDCGGDVVGLSPSNLLVSKGFSHLIAMKPTYFFCAKVFPFILFPPRVCLFVLMALHLTRPPLQIRHEVSFKTVTHKICSDTCFNVYRRANGLIMNCCEQCGDYLPNRATANHFLLVDGQQKRFCCHNCIRDFKQVMFGAAGYKRDVCSPFSHHLIHKWKN